MFFNTFRQRMGPGKKLYPVIHVENAKQARRNVARAKEAGADGVFLINHEIDTLSLMTIFQQIRAEHPDMFIGINLLTETAEQAFAIIRDELVDALWVDDSGIGDEISDYPAKLLEFTMRLKQWQGFYFPSVAFKHQSPVREIERAARNAARMDHVVVTSGESTGSAPAVEKIAGMKRAIGDHPLAIASGMTPENISNFLPHADVFMVATGISDNFTNLNLEKTARMAELIHGWT